MKVNEVAHLAQKRRSLLCVGLDPAPEALPPGHKWRISWIKGYLLEIIQASLPYAIGFKLNSAFYEQWGSSGWTLLKAVRSHIPADYLVILDGKRGDIAHTNRAYVRAIYEELGFTAVTVHPYLGWESLRPFYEVEGKWVFVVLRTTESDSWQALVWQEIVAKRPVGVPATIGWVWGAHHGAELRTFRQIEPTSWLLMPGMGAQGAELDPQLPVYPALIAVSRGILRDPAALPSWQQRTALYLPTDQSRLR